MIESELVYIDVETTGLDPDNDEIVEVSAIKFNDRGKTLGTFYKLCSTVIKPIPEEATKIHGITNEQVTDEKPYMDIRASLAEFIGKRTLVGHNIIGFDIKFLKLEPVKIEDTLLMCRAIWPKGNSLGPACKRMGIDFDKKKAHSATYDVEMGVHLYLALKKRELDEREVQTDMFKKSLPTQVYSFSRIRLFHQCPYKWKMLYLVGHKEPDSDHLVVGRVVHKICEMAALWSYAESFANKFVIHSNKNKIKVNRSLIDDIAKNIKEKRPFYLPSDPAKISLKNVGMYLFRNPALLTKYYFVGMADLINEMNKSITEEEAEIVSMPDRAAYERIIQVALIKEHCINPSLIKDIEYLADKFYYQKDFSLYTGEMALVEKKLIFDKNYKCLGDWFSNDGYLRGVIDVMEYNVDYVTIIDYKSGRTMLTERELKTDPQMKLYVLLTWRYLPKDSVRRIIVKHHYIRFNQTVEYEVVDPESVAKEAQEWVDNSIHEIEQELLKADKDSFKPKRNEYCGSCFLADENKCPLFDVNKINNVEDPQNFNVRTMDDLKRAWKKIEVNKAEVKNLTKKCKTFVESCSERAKIDDEATLDFWVKESRSYRPVDAVKTLLKKKVKLENLLPFFSLSEENLVKLLKKNKVELTEDELKSISGMKSRGTFDAFTEKEAKKNDFKQA